MIAIVHERAKGMAGPESSVLQRWATFQSLKNRGCRTVLLSVLQTWRLQMKSPRCCLSGASQCCKTSPTSFFLGHFSQEALRIKDLRKGPHRNHWSSDYGGSGQSLRHPEPWTKPSISTNERKLPKGQKSTEIRSVEKVRVNSLSWPITMGHSESWLMVLWVGPSTLDRKLFSLQGTSGDICK